MSQRHGSSCASLAAAGFGQSIEEKSRLHHGVASVDDVFIQVLHAMTGHVGGRGGRLALGMKHMGHAGLSGECVGGIRQPLVQ